MCTCVHIHTNVHTPHQTRHVQRVHLGAAIPFLWLTFYSAFPCSQRPASDPWPHIRESICIFNKWPWVFQVALVVKNQPDNAAGCKRRVRSLGGEDPLEEGTETHSSILAWRIPRTEEPGGLQPTGSHRAGHDWTNLAGMRWSISLAQAPSQVWRTWKGTRQTRSSAFTELTGDFAVGDDEG